MFYRPLPFKMDPDGAIWDPSESGTGSFSVEEFYDYSRPLLLDLLGEGLKKLPLRIFARKWRCLKNES